MNNKPIYILDDITYNSYEEAVPHFPVAQVVELHDCEHVTGGALMSVKYLIATNCPNLTVSRSYGIQTIAVSGCDSITGEALAKASSATVVNCRNFNPTYLNARCKSSIINNYMLG